MKPAVVIDTNVPILANSQAASDLDCHRASIRKLIEIRRERLVLVDSSGLIFKEYRTHLSPRGQPGLGDAFFKWLWDHQANKQVCRQVVITPSQAIEGGFAEFPADPELAGFDLSDRKFVAVVLASGEHAPVINASDTDWWHYREVLERNGVHVEFICPALMRARPTR